MFQPRRIGRNVSIVLKHECLKVMDVTKIGLH